MRVEKSLSGRPRELTRIGASLLRSPVMEHGCHAIGHGWSSHRLVAVSGVRESREAMAIVRDSVRTRGPLRRRFVEGCRPGKCRPVEPPCQLTLEEDITYQTSIEDRAQIPTECLRRQGNVTPARSERPAGCIKNRPTNYTVIITDCRRSSLSHS